MMLLLGFFEKLKVTRYKSLKTKSGAGVDWEK